MPGPKNRQSSSLFRGTVCPIRQTQELDCVFVNGSDAAKGMGLTQDDGGAVSQMTWLFNAETANDILQIPDASVACTNEMVDWVN